MSIRVTCGSCGAKLKAPDGSDDRTFLCPRCKTRNVIPRLPAPVTEPRLIQMRCQACGTIISAPDSMTGKTGLCPNCREAVAVRPNPPARFTPPPPELELDDDPPPRRQSSRRDDDRVGFVCPFCGTRSWPITRSQISTGGWVVFVVMLFVCFPLCFIGLLMKDEYRVCSGCGMKLG